MKESTVVILMIIAACILLPLCMWGCPIYNVWLTGKHAEALYCQVEWEQRIEVMKKQQEKETKNE